MSQQTCNTEKRLVSLLLTLRNTTWGRFSPGPSGCAPGWPAWLGE